MNRSKITITRESPGFRRMQERLGPDAAEKLRLDTVRLQQEALKGIRPELKNRKPQEK